MHGDGEVSWPKIKVLLSSKVPPPYLGKIPGIDPCKIPPSNLKFLVNEKGKRSFFYANNYIVLGPV